MDKRTRRPPNLIVAVDEPIRPGLALGMGVQHSFAMSSTLVLAALLAYSVSESVDTASRFVQVSMIASGIGTILQSLKRGPVGSGYLCPNLSGPAFFPASLLAAQTGGLSLMFGMTLLAGAFQALLSRFIHRLRAVLPPEVTGVIVSMVGISLVGPGVSNMAGLATGDSTSTSSEVILGLATLIVMFALTVWGTGLMRLYSVLIGIGFGYALATALGIFSMNEIRVFATDTLIRWPAFNNPLSLQFDAALVVPFLIAGLASTVKTVGDLSTAQKINDDQWTGPEMGSIRGGVLADALAVISAALLGGMGQSTSSSNVGVSLATGVTSRVVGFTAGAIFILGAFVPVLTHVFVLMPTSVKGAVLVYAACFMIVAGLQLVMTRLMDARKIFVVGGSVIAGLSVDFLPGLYTDLPSTLNALATSSLSLATVTAIVLNLIFRIGTVRRSTLDIGPGEDRIEAVIKFLRSRGSVWGARRDVIELATTALLEFVEAVQAPAEGQDTIRINAHFDQFRLDIYALYGGPAVPLPDARPDPRELSTNADTMRQLSGYIIRKAATDVHTGKRGPINMLHLTFEH